MIPSELRELVDRLRSSGETDTVEFKENNAEPERIGERLCGLSNAAKLAGAHGGYLVYGVNDATHEVVGTFFDLKRAKKGAEELENWLLRGLSPQPEFHHDVLDYDGKRVVVMTIGAAKDQPVKFRGAGYVRVGTLTKPLGDYPNHERKLWAVVKPFEKSDAIEEMEDAKALAMLETTRFFELLEVQEPDTRADKLRVLTKHGLVTVTDSGRVIITNLGALMIAKDLRDFPALRRKALRVVVYGGSDKTGEVRSDRTFWRGYAIDFPDALSYIMDRTPTNEAIKAAVRVETRMYPEIAVREFMANELIHQDFSVVGAGPTVDIFDNRIEFTNPGAPLIPTDRFIDSQSTLRNDLVAWTMRQCHYCEERGLGIDKALKYVEVYQLPAPRFEASVDCDFMRVTLLAPQKLSQMSRADRIWACYQHVALRFTAGDRATNESIRQRFGLSESENYTASKILRDTVDAKRIRIEDMSAKSKKFTKYVPYWAPQA